MILLNQTDKRYKIDYDKKVFVYKNLHKDCWSVKQGGLVKAHAEDLEMWDCSFQVNAKGREKVIKEKKKNVHAGIRGYLDYTKSSDWASTQLKAKIKTLFSFKNNSTVALSTDVTYNPYRFNSFVEKVTEEPVYHSELASLSHNKVKASKIINL
jgi:hypothetical protein